MMRSRWGSLVLLTACGSLAFAGCAAGATRAPESTDAHASRSPVRVPTRTWNVTVSPMPDDLALAEISFHPTAPRQAISGRTVRVSATAPFGDDYMAYAAPVSKTDGWLRLLVLVVNRPSPLADPVDVHLRVTARSTLGKPVVWTLSSPLAHPNRSLTPALCDLPFHGSSLGASGLRALGSRGASLPGFGVASSVAQAYDVACGLPYESAFVHDVAHPSNVPGAPVPAPGPPVGKLPGEGCVPAPGYACPGAVSNASPGTAAEGSRRAPAGAH
jgi:hypothetical protein